MLIASRVRTALYLLACIVFVTIGISQITHSQSERDLYWGWASCIFFGIGIGVFLVSIVKPSTIALDTDGFTVTIVGRRRNKVQWKDIEPLYISTLSRGVKVAAYRYAAGKGPKSLASRIGKALGADGYLPKAFAQRPQVMVEKLNDYRERALAANRSGQNGVW